MDTDVREKSSEGNVGHFAKKGDICLQSISIIDIDRLNYHDCV